MYTMFSRINQKGRHYSKYLGGKGLQHAVGFKKQHVQACTELIWLRIRSSGRLL